jgi:hypothetical protein
MQKLGVNLLWIEDCSDFGSERRAAVDAGGVGAGKLGGALHLLIECTGAGAQEGRGVILELEL